MSSRLRLIVVLFIAGVFVSCASKPIVFDLSPEEFSDSNVRIRPWFGETPYLLRVDNTGDETIFIDTSSIVLVAPSNEARKLETEPQSDVLPPKTYVFLRFSGPTIFETQPDAYLLRLYGESPPVNSPVQIPTDALRLEAMSSLRGQRFKLRFVYSLGDDPIERIAEFQISGAQIIDEWPQNYRQERDTVGFLY